MPNNVRIYEHGRPGKGLAAAYPNRTAGDGTVTNRSPHGRNRTVDRALALLVLVSWAKHPLRFSELQRQTGIPKGSLHTLVRSLLEAGFLQSSPRGMSVGFTVFEVGTSIPLVRSARSIADPALDELTAVTRESSHFGTLVEGDVLYLNRRAASYDLLSVSRIGHRKRAYGTALGKAMLAYLEDDEIAAIYPGELAPLTENTVRTRKELITELAGCRSRGFASECEESTPGVRCIGMAFRVEGMLFGLSLTAPVQRVSATQLEEMQPSLAAAADRVDKAMRVSSWLGELDVELGAEGTPSDFGARTVPQGPGREAGQGRSKDSAAR